MDSYLVRISTFARWPTDTEVDVYALARQGLYYSGTGDGVICSACHVTLDGWKWKDCPLEKHRQVSPGCKFVIDGATSQLGRHSGHNNYTSDSCRGALATDSIVVPKLYAPETCGLTSDSCRGALATDSIVVSKLHAPETCGPTQYVAEPSPAKSVESVKDIQSNEPPKYPQYSKLADRIESLRVGNIPQGQTAEKLAEAGWFFVGPGDKVRCYQCGGNLRDWEAGDDPWREHGRWYKDCAHLKAFRSSSEPKHQNTADAVTFRIDPREVKARMDTPMVKAILNMGFENSLVSQVIENQLTTIGDDFPSAEALLNAIFALSDPKSTTPPQANNLPTHAVSTAINPSIAMECNNKLSPESTSCTVGTIEHLDDENQRLRDSRTCKVCKEAEVNTVFLPCGHLVCCDRCASSLTGCIVCRTSIRGTVKTFLS